MPRQKAVMTPKWEKVLEFIRVYIKLHGASPSYEVMAKGLGLRSKANMHRIVRRLSEEGHLDVKPRGVYGVRVRDRSVERVLGL
jgi:SOS-response transcriptional repressor LexA